MKWLDPNELKATARALSQQAITPEQGQMVSGRYVGPNAITAIAQVLKGKLAGDLNRRANEESMAQSTALTRALSGDASMGPQQPLEQRLGSLQFPQAQQMAQQLALRRAEAENAPQPRLVKGEEIGAPSGSVFQFMPGEGYKELFAPKTADLPLSVREFQFAQQNPEFAAYQIAQKRAGATNISNVVGGKGDPLTPAQESIDKRFGEEVFYPAVVKGGLADTQAQISSLEQVKKDLEKSDNLSGPLIGMLPKSMRSIVAPGSVNAQQLVEQTVQRSLKDILGGQFAQQEALELMARAYNPSLEESFNKPRVEKLIGVLQNAEKNKRDAVAYYQKFGTMRGYQGQIPSMASIRQEFDAAIGQNNQKQNVPEGLDPQIWKFMTPEERALFQ